MSRDRFPVGRPRAPHFGSAKRKDLERVLTAVRPGGHANAIRIDVDGLAMKRGSPPPDVRIKLVLPAEAKLMPKELGPVLRGIVRDRFPQGAFPAELFSRVCSERCHLKESGRCQLETPECNKGVQQKNGHRYI